MMMMRSLQFQSTRAFGMMMLMLIVLVSVNFVSSFGHLRGIFISMQVASEGEGDKFDNTEIGEYHKEEDCNVTSPTTPYAFTDSILINNNTSRKIPRIIHMISTKTRCTTKPFHDNFLAWKKALPDHSFLFHDSQSIQRVLSRSWPDFLNLRFIDLVPCMNGQGAAVVDLVRLLVLYEYGGLYVDTDEGPGSQIGTLLASNETIDSEVILFENRGAPIQGCFLACPQHPFLYYAILQVVDNLLQVPDVGQAYVPFVTGPQAFTAAYAKFRGLSLSSGNETLKIGEHGRHLGKEVNNTVDMIFSGNNRNYYVQIGAVGGAAKAEYYKIIGAKDFVRARGFTRTRRNNLSCLDTILKYRRENRSSWEEQ